MAAERMIHVALGQKGAELFPEGLDDVYGCTAGMETLLRIGELRGLPE